jgi:signal transduction histidine kinase
MTSLDHSAHISIDVFQRRLETISALNTHYLTVETENMAISTFMQAAMQHTQAIGASYLPMDEDGRPLTLISQGVITQQPDIAAWESVLEAPPIRTQCRVCLKQELISDTCPLFSNPISEAHNIYCVRLNQGNNKLGILNLYLPTDVRIDPGTQTFLQTLGDNTALALSNLRQEQKNQHLQEQFKNQALDTEVAAKIEQAAITAERMRLGREIHDGLAQILGYVKMELSQMEGFLQNGDKEKLSQAIRTSHQAMTEAFVEAREAIDDLRITTLTANFTTWLLETGNNFQDGFDILVEIGDFPPDLDFSIAVKNQLTRITQEALANIRKHAQARRVQIRFQQTAAHATVIIQDDGVGFDVEAASGSSQHGLRSMPERAELVNLKFRIESKLDKGTQIIIKIPGEAVL